MSSSEPLVSIIVRSTARPTLERALASAGAQDWPAVEIVVVAASGPSHPLLPERAGHHAVRRVSSDAPLLRAAAANAGLEAAQGAWITFLDDDDTLDTTHVAGLVAAAQREGARVITALARVTLADGSVRPWGQPFALTELYARNFLHLSTVMFAREFIDDGLRFDPVFDIMQDWDFFLQLAQRSPFASCGQRTFEWHADLGSSGAAGPANHDAQRFATYRDRIHAKWRNARDALASAIEPLLTDAGAAAQARDFARVAAACERVLAVAPNEPFALDMLAMVCDARGAHDEALRLASLAAAIRPYEPGLLYNLARRVARSGDTAAARRIAEDALRRAPGFAPARALIASLPP